MAKRGKDNAQAAAVPAWSTVIGPLNEIFVTIQHGIA